MAHELTSETIETMRFDLSGLPVEVEESILSKCSQYASEEGVECETWASGPCWSGYAIFSGTNRAAVDRAAWKAWRYAGRFKIIKEMRAKG